MRNKQTFFFACLALYRNKTTAWLKVIPNGEKCRATLACHFYPYPIIVDLTVPQFTVPQLQLFAQIAKSQRVYLSSHAVSVGLW